MLLICWRADKIRARNPQHPHQIHLAKAHGTTYALCNLNLWTGWKRTVLDLCDPMAGDWPEVAAHCRTHGLCQGCYLQYRANVRAGLLGLGTTPLERKRASVARTQKQRRKAEGVGV